MKILASLVYPVLLISVATIIVTYLVTAVIPRFALLYRDLGVELPTPTKILVAVTVDYRFVVLGFFAALVATVVGVFLWSRTEDGGTAFDRFKFRPFGLAGGESAAPSALYLIRDGKKQALRSKVTNMMVQRGDIIRLETSGGGGFGDAKLRARELVERDVRLGYVSAAAARESYGAP